jgi:hypothetical protein
LTERWRAELTGLPRLDDPERAWQRASTGIPTEPAPQLPPTRQRIGAAVVALALFAGAGVFVYSAFGGNEGSVGGPEEDASDASVLRIRCDGERAEVQTPFVRAHPDGVHVVLDAPAGTTVIARSARFPYREWGLWRGDSEQELVRTLPPGDAFVWCDRGSYRSTESRHEVPVVVDGSSAGFVPFDLDCRPEDERWLEFPGSQEPMDDAPSVAMAVEVAFPDLSPLDVIEAAGYPEPPEKTSGTFRVVRGGRVVMWMLIDTFVSPYSVLVARACHDAGIGTPDRDQDSFVMTP